jgi:alpha-amylase
MRSVIGTIAHGVSISALAAALLACGTGRAPAGVLFQGYFVNVPVPTPGHPDFWWDHIAKQAKALREAGFTAVWLPPVCKGAGGASSVGFDVFDDYDLGSKNQKGTIPTRYGTREKLERCVAILRANGLDVYIDVVDNQRDGGDNQQKYRYVDADGKPDGGRFAKDPGDFHCSTSGVGVCSGCTQNVPGCVPEDPNVPGPDCCFGDDLAPINGTPSRHCFNGLLASADWMTRALDIQGYRLDDVKGISTQFIPPLLNNSALNGKFAVGEFFDGNLDLVRGWISNTAGRASAFDFPLRFNFLVPMCNNPGSFDMSQLDHAGLAGVDPFHAVTFVENHDTDRNSPIVTNKAQGYAYILTSEGYPCVFFKDYSTDPGSYGMKPVIDNLIFIHEKIAAGATQQRWKNHDVFAYERLGGAHLLVGLNNNGSSAQTITVDTGFGANVKLHDYTGHSGDVQTDGNGQVTITIPKNTNGLGYVCYSGAGIGGPFEVVGHDVTQDYEGAQDLDIKPADNTAFVQVCRVFVAAGLPIKGALRFDTTKWTNATTITLELDDPSGARLASHDFAQDTPQGESISATAGPTGFYTFRIRSANTPTENAKPSYKLSVTYRAPQVLDPGQ